jgi:Ni/Co efflux regulator RcnB
MKKILLFAIAVVCFAGILALAQEASKSADQKEKAQTEEMSDVVVVSDEMEGDKDFVVAAEETETEAPDQDAEVAPDANAANQVSN